MIEAGIYDGDTVIIQRTETADSGTIVVALVDNEEVTLKRLRGEVNRSRWSPPTRLTSHASAARIKSRCKAG